jgi:hypothetical protein
VFLVRCTPNRRFKFGCPHQGRHTHKNQQSKLRRPHQETHTHKNHSSPPGVQITMPERGLQMCDNMKLYELVYRRSPSLLGGCMLVYLIIGFANRDKWKKPSQSYTRPAIFRIHRRKQLSPTSSSRRTCTSATGGISEGCYPPSQQRQANHPVQSNPTLQ